MISVLIPVYNVEKYLHVSINSVLKQTYQDFEIICVDDASTDSSLQILEYFSKKDDRIKVFRNPSNKGLGFTRNRAMEEAEGEYILFLDSDDWISSNALEMLVEEAEKNNSEVVMFKAIVYYEEPHNFGMEAYYDMGLLNKFSGTVFNHWDFDKSRFFSIPIGACNKFYLKSFLDEYDIRFPNENYIHEDNPFYCKMFINAERISFLDEYFYNRRRRSDSIMALNNERLFDNFKIVELVLNVFLENREIYEYYKEQVMNYVFNLVLNNKYDQIEDQYKEEFFKGVQEVYRKFIQDYGLYSDIKENVDEEILNRFKFEEIVENLLKK